jgi:hypothetical protein
MMVLQFSRNIAIYSLILFFLKEGGREVSLTTVDSAIRLRAEILDWSGFSLCVENVIQTGVFMV